jgi:hypothetical protein
MGEYKKTTIDDINIPQYCLFFIETIQDEINKTDFEEYDTVELEIITSKYPYCYDALKLVVKTFTRKGFYVKIPTFTSYKDDKGIKVWDYKWDIKLSDDLPF